MANELTTQIVNIDTQSIALMADAVAKSGLFGLKTKEQAMALMLVAQAEGRHPASAAKDYHIINNNPSKKSEAMLRDFLLSGGTVKWHVINDVKAEATFSHPQGGEATFDWTLERANKAGVGNNPMWKKYPRAMLRSRVVSEGVRTIYPAATSGMYVPEEVHDFSPKYEPPKDAIDVESKPATNSRQAQLDDAIPEFPRSAHAEPTLEQRAKTMAEFIDGSYTAEELDREVLNHVKTMDAMRREKPEWHQKMLDKIEQRRLALQGVKKPQRTKLEPDIADTSDMSDDLPEGMRMTEAEKIEAQMKEAS